MPTTEMSRQEKGDGIRITLPEGSQVFKVVHKKEAVQNDKYRLSEDMQQEIRNRASLPENSFSDGRLKIEDMVIEWSDKKRKIQDGS